MFPPAPAQPDHLTWTQGLGQGVPGLGLRGPGDHSQDSWWAPGRQHYDQRQVTIITEGAPGSGGRQMDWAPQPAPVQPSLVKSRAGSWATAGHSCLPVPRGGSWINTTEVRPRGPGEWACPAVWWAGAEMVRACGVVMQGYAGSCLEAVRRTTLHTGVPHTRCPESPPGLQEQVSTGHRDAECSLENHRLTSGGQAGASASPPGTGEGPARPPRAEKRARGWSPESPGRSCVTEQDPNLSEPKLLACDRRQAHYPPQGIDKDRASVHSWHEWSPATLAGMIIPNPGESDLVSNGNESACSAGDPGSTPGSGRSPGEGNGNSLQYSCLENPMDRGTWWATVYGVPKSQTRLSNFHFPLLPPGGGNCSPTLQPSRAPRRTQMQTLFCKDFSPPSMCPGSAPAG